MRFIEASQLPAKLREFHLRVASCPAAELPDAYLEQLIQLSRQPHIAEYESRKGGKSSRFTDRETFQRWAAKNDRVIYLLLFDKPEAKDGDTLEVSGVIWFGIKSCPLPDPAFAPFDVTFSIRLYESSKGKGLSVPFMQAAHQDVTTAYYPNHPIWLDTDKDNEIAQRSYTKFGYKTLGTYDNRIVMGYKVES